MKKWKLISFSFTLILSLFAFTACGGGGGGGDSVVPGPNGGNGGSGYLVPRVTSWFFGNGWYWYELGVRMGDNEHKASSVTISGPGLTGTLSLTWEWDAVNNEGDWHLDPRPVLPDPPPTAPVEYTVTVVDGDGTHTWKPIMTGYVTELATCLSPIPSSSVTSPVILTWSSVSIPDFECYNIEVGQLGGAMEWITDIYQPSYSISLTPGEYEWHVQVADTSDNRSLNVCGNFFVVP